MDAAKSAGGMDYLEANIVPRKPLEKSLEASADLVKRDHSESSPQLLMFWQIQSRCKIEVKDACLCCVKERRCSGESKRNSKASGPAPPRPLESFRGLAGLPPIGYALNSFSTFSRLLRAPLQSSQIPVYCMTRAAYSMQGHQAICAAPQKIFTATSPADIVPSTVTRQPFNRYATPLRARERWRTLGRPAIVHVTS
jgi:hypothetical protein